MKELARLNFMFETSNTEKASTKANKITHIVAKDVLYNFRLKPEFAFCSTCSK